MEFKSNDYLREANRFGKIGEGNGYNYTDAACSFVNAYWHLGAGYEDVGFRDEENEYCRKFVFNVYGKKLFYYKDIGLLSDKQQYLIIIEMFRKYYNLGGRVK